MILMCDKTLLIIQCYSIAWAIEAGHSRSALAGLSMEDLAQHSRLDRGEARLHIGYVIALYCL